MSRPVLHPETSGNNESLDSVVSETALWTRDQWRRQSILPSSTGPGISGEPTHVQEGKCKVTGFV